MVDLRDKQAQADLAASLIEKFNRRRGKVRERIIAMKKLAEKLLIWPILFPYFLSFFILYLSNRSSDSERAQTSE